MIEAIKTITSLYPNINDVLESRVCEIQQERIDAINRMKAEERKRKVESSNLQKRKQGSKQIREADYDSNERIVDEYGYRWLLCTVCGQIYREDDMSSYGGKNSVNKGVCRKCRNDFLRINLSETVIGSCFKGVICIFVFRWRYLLKIFVFCSDTYYT